MRTYLSKFTKPRSQRSRVEFPICRGRDTAGVKAEVEEGVFEGLVVDLYARRYEKEKVEPPCSEEREKKETIYGVRGVRHDRARWAQGTEFVEGS